MNAIFPEVVLRRAARGGIGRRRNLSIAQGFVSSGSPPACSIPSSFSFMQSSPRFRWPARRLQGSHCTQANGPSPIHSNMPAWFCRGRIHTGATSPVDSESQPQARTQLYAGDCMIAGLCTLFMGRAHVLGSAIGLKPSTSLNLHSLLTRRKY